MNTGTSTTKTRSTRKFFLPLLLPLLPPLGPPPEGIGARHERDCSFLEVRELGPIPSRVHHDLRSSRCILVTTASSILFTSSSSSPPPPPAHAPAATAGGGTVRWRRHATSPTPVQQRAREPRQPRKPTRDCRLRPGNLRQRCRPHPRRRSLSSLKGVVQLADLHLHCPVRLRSPWGFGATRAQHHGCDAGCGQGHLDAQLLMSQP